MWRLSAEMPALGLRPSIGRVLAIVAALLIGALSGLAEARAQWTEIGSRTFQPVERSIKIDVTKAVPVKAVRLINRGGPVTILNVRVIYRDGSAFNQARRFSLARGERTRVLASLGVGKPISAVVLTLEPAAVACGHGAPVLARGDTGPTLDAAGRVDQQLRARAHSLRVVAPAARERAPLQEDGGPDSMSVVRREPLEVEHSPPCHASTPDGPFSRW